MERRKILKSTLGLGVAGGAMPSSWVKPVIDSVVLPTHAQTSISCAIAGTWAINLLEEVVPNARQAIFRDDGTGEYLDNNNQIVIWSQSGSVVDITTTTRDGSGSPIIIEAIVNTQCNSMSGSSVQAGTTRPFSAIRV